MHRREMLRMLSTTALAPMLSPDLFNALRAAQTSSGYALRTLNAHQNDTVVAMIDLIIPATDTPGAKGARVNEFMDVVLTDWATLQERSKFLSGVDAVDQQSGELFGKTFLAASPAQQTMLIRAMDDEVDWAHPPNAEQEDEEAPGYDSHLRGKFFRIFKMMTLHGYYTSEIGFTQELKKEIIPGAQHGCIPVPVGKKA